MDIFDNIEIDLEFPCMPDDPNCGDSIPSMFDKLNLNNLILSLHNTNIPIELALSPA